MIVTALPKQGTKIKASIHGDHFLLDDGTHIGHDESNPDNPNEVSGLAVALAEKLKEFGITVQVQTVG